MAQSIIGIVGLGPATSAIARRLSASGARVLVHDRQPDRCAAFAGYRPGIEIAGSLADIGAECRDVIVWRPTLDALTEALFGSPDRSGLGHELPAGALVIDMSPGSPDIPPRLQGALGQRAIGVVDAGVLSGQVGDARFQHDPEAALTGQLEIAIGGFDAFVDRAAAVLAPLGRIHRTGRLGSARGACTVAASLRAVLVKAVREAEALGLASGLSPETIAAMIELARLPDGDRDEAALAIDAAAAVTLARELGLQAPLAECATN